MLAFLDVAWHPARVWLGTAAGRCSFSRCSVPFDQGQAVAISVAGESVAYLVGSWLHGALYRVTGPRSIAYFETVCLSSSPWR